MGLDTGRLLEMDQWTVVPLHRGYQGYGGGSKRFSLLVDTVWRMVRDLFFFRSLGHTCRTP